MTQDERTTRMEEDIELKTWPQFFQAVKSGDKRHEVRVNDRPYCVGSVLRLREYDPDLGQYTGDELRVRVTYATTAFLPDGLIAMSVEASGPAHPPEPIKWTQEDPWRDIASAPKDGTWVLLHSPRSRTRPARIGHWWSSRWQFDQGYGDPPTHWTPLPDPPKGAL